MFNTNSTRTSYASKVEQPFWDGYDPDGGNDQPFFAGIPAQQRSETMGKVCYNTLLLHQRGIDPYQVYLAYSRELGISPWISMRMNDIHYTDNLEHPIHNYFRKQNPSFWRVTHRFKRWEDRAFDYARQEVRDHQLALIEELLERYDMDGLELDWMRHPLNFRPGCEHEGLSLLTDFVAQVRRLANQRSKTVGHDVKIAVRVPSRPLVARDLGFDVLKWAKMNLVDMIVITPMWHSLEFDMPVEFWKELLGDAPVTLAAGLEISLLPYWGAYSPSAYIRNTAETVFGAAASLLHRGADLIYLFNYMDTGGASMDDKSDFRKVLDNAGSLATAAGQTRRHLVTFSDTWAPGGPRDTVLPVECSSEKWKISEFRVHIGPKPSGGTACVFIGLGREGNTDIKATKVFVNGQSCPACNVKPPEPIHAVAVAVAGFDVPIDALKDGYNMVDVTTDQQQSQQIVWVEIMIIP